MGVLPCNRNGCQNIMCDRHCYEYGYICWECFNELVELGKDTNIQNFMDTPKDYEPSWEDKNQAEEYFDKVFESSEWSPNNE